MTELELKLEIPSNRLLRVAAAMREGKATRQRLHARYFDTEEGTLAKHGLVVRVRKEGRRWVQTAKGPSGGLLERLEHNVEIAAPAAGEIPAVDLARHVGTPVGRKIFQALKRKAHQTLPIPVLLYEVDVQRLKRSVKFADSVVEVALDQGRIVSSPRSLVLCELEVELKHGKPEHAVQLARNWCAQYGLWLSSTTKSIKGQRLRGERCFGSAVSATAPEFDRHADGKQIVMAVLQSCLKQVLANASEVAGGSVDPEHIHQLRIGIRRLRTAIRELEPLAEGMEPAWEAPLVDAFRDLGRHRDDSWLALGLQPRIEAAGGPSVDTHHAGADIPEPGDVVRLPAFQDALFCLIGFVHCAESGNAGSTHEIAKKVVRARLKKLRSQVVKDGTKFLSLDEMRQHRVRKRLKRLRYLTEFSAPLFSTRGIRAFDSALHPAQDALGLYNDELMALQAYRRLASKDPQAWFGVGWLSARRIPNASVCRHELEAFAQVRPFWG